MRDPAAHQLLTPAPPAAKARGLRPQSPSAEGGFAPSASTAETRRARTCPCGGGCPRCLSGPHALAKLAFGQPADAYEREADRVAEEVVRMAEPFGTARAAADAPAHASPRTGGRLAFSPAPGGVQRQPAGGGGATQPAPQPAPKTWKQIWPDFTFARISRTPEAATAVALQLVEAPRDTEDLRSQGAEVVRWLHTHGEQAVAAELLDKVRTSFTVAWATDEVLPALTFGGGPYAAHTVLVGLGMDAARAGKHDEAFKFFGIAHEILSYYADQTTEHRLAADITRGEAYTDLRYVYDRMREIYESYYVLEREALLGGDKARAELMRAKASELFKALQQDYTLSGRPAELAEADPVTTSKGPALRLVGANEVTTDLTELPNLTSPSEIGQGVRLDSLENVQSTLNAQASLQAEIRREPDALKAFGSKPLDLNDTKQRQEVWRVMYGAYRKAGPGALGSLMWLVGKYLKAYTAHTTYNIRDFGANYLESEFPTDLAGRVQMDCGVYALTVAWDVYQTVKQGDPKMRVDFRLVAFLDHVSLIIDDKSTGESYIVNNDNIKRINQAFPTTEAGLRPFFRQPPPAPGEEEPALSVVNWVEPEKVAEEEYGALRDVPYLITPAFYYDLGSTKDKPKAFHDDAWKRYIKAVSDIADKQAAFTEDLKKKTGLSISTYSLQKQFSDDARRLDVLMGELAASDAVSDPQQLAARLGVIMPLAVNALVMFEKLSKAFAPLSAQRRFAYSWPGPIHPLVRVALSLLRLKKLGGTLTTHQEKFLKFCEAVFTREMAEHRERGEAGTF